MKKIYSAPLTEVVKINVEQMICVSGFGNSLDPEEEKVLGSGALDKEGNSFFDPNLW